MNRAKCIENLLHFRIIKFVFCFQFSFEKRKIDSNTWQNYSKSSKNAEQTLYVGLSVHQEIHQSKHIIQWNETEMKLGINIEILVDISIHCYDIGSIWIVDRLQNQFAHSSTNSKVCMLCMLCMYLYIIRFKWYLYYH